MVDKDSRKIICTAHGKGREHDLHLFKTSPIRLKENIECSADKGYLGIQKLHSKCCIPIKNPKSKKLSDEEKKKHRELARIRVVDEHIYRKLKCLKLCRSVIATVENDLD